MLRSIKNLKSPVTSLSEVDQFRESFRFFKRRKKVEDLPMVIDFESRKPHDSVISFTNSENYFVGDDCLFCAKLGLLPHKQWQIYSLKGFSGFMLIKNPFTVNGQRQWIQNTIDRYTRKPLANTNLDHHQEFVEDVWAYRINDGSMKRGYIDKLSWATLGYHYNWTSKLYDRASHSDFPNCLAELAKHVAVCLNFPTFKPETAIVNYYSSKSTLGIHSDNIEENLDEPVLSFSFGQTAVFLLGTNNRTEKPVPIFLRSGDIMILSGACRTYYHAIPSIIQEHVSDRYQNSEGDVGWKPFQQYVEKHRVNITVRRVYSDDKNKSEQK